MLAAVVVGYGFYSLFQTTVDNLVARGIQTGTNFFDEVAPFQIGFTPFFDYKLGESKYIDVFFVGIQNTILVAVLGIIAATLLGFFIGVIRLSPELARFARSACLHRNLPQCSTALADYVLELCDFPAELASTEEFNCDGRFLS